MSENKNEVSELDKHINLYKSTIGQVNKMLENTVDEEAIEYLEKAKEYIAKGYVTENRAMFKRFFKMFGNALTKIGEMFEGLFE